MEKRKTTGLVLGKFMPPHKGHFHLINFARNYVDNLYIIVEKTKNEPIPSELRITWLRSAFPECKILHLTDLNPQEPVENPDFWKIWQNSLNKILPQKVDYIFASENYGHKLAELLDTEFIPVDMNRESVPISATQIRNNPDKYWEYIPDAVKPYYVKKACIVGPESTGKSTLADNLANHYKTKYVPEYAKTLIHSQKGKLSYRDMSKIAKGQLALERSVIPSSNRVLICDTDILTTTVWSNFLYGKCDNWLEKAAINNHYDLYLLMDIDVPWIDDVHRYSPDNRDHFYTMIKNKLIEKKAGFVEINGTWNERLQKSIAAIDLLLQI
ncbi:MAG: transcriptional regulator [Candidatus Margulisiibacteriota bacterium]|nr:MAG: transcriptional regulator [Candidatus Margulisbacteria bacterium GWD2_39_127]OGI01227.1 MAG: transcriptional regulator [Candidatus Margulisbacteria bacterium GWF2_38_17]PZM80212.1 MAG: transcriptional regulator [Candidatus Margulisiibacteriota bacterium]HAR64136.1 transcriptional regulator [Candidatus Margulisiibacteriota bacterium]HCY36919.1 transcriptional regulator [Candidatus Margulisiibacteriota bacterium]